MNASLHQRALRLIRESVAGGIRDRDRKWLADHLTRCPICARRASHMDAIVSGLRAVAFPSDPKLVHKTRAAVRARTRELERQRPAGIWIWVTTLLSWSWAVWTAPWVWKWLGWAGDRLGMPGWAWQMAFGLWWLLPALALAAALGITAVAGANSNRHSVRDLEQQL